MAMPHKTTRGTIQYTSRKPGREGVERGREHFAITLHGDGARTLRAQCEIDDPPPVLRDVTLSFNAAWQPLDCFVRLTVADKLVGSSWFRFTAHSIECEANTVLEGRISQRVALASPAIGFGTHPIQADAMLCRMYDLSKGPGWQSFGELYMCSLDHRGATGPLIFRHPIGVQLRFIGRETASVGAGTFAALHFQIAENANAAAAIAGATVGHEVKDTANAPGKHPPYDLWCTADGDYVMLKAEVTGYMMTAYELIKLER